MAFDLKQGIGTAAQAAMAFMAAKKAGPQAVAALMQGIQQGKLQKQRMAQEEQDRAIRQQMLQAQIEDRKFSRQNIEADNKRQDEQMQYGRRRDARNDVEAYGTSLLQNPSMVDPAQAENAMMQRAVTAASDSGLEPDALTGSVGTFAPQFAQALPQKKKKQAQELYTRAEKRYNPKGENPDWETSITLQTGEQFGDITPAKLRETFDAPALGQDGAPAMPPRPAVVPPNRNLQSKEVLRNGKRVVVNFEPDTGKYFDLAGAEVTDIEPIAPVSASSGPARERTLTPNSALSMTRSLRNDFVRETAAARSVLQQFELMKSSMAAVNSGAAAPGSQGVLVTFQKILDPTSVVRESEYARSAAGQSLLSRLEGQWMKIQQGGAGVPAAELQKFVDLAEQFAQNQVRFANETKAQIDAIADEYGLKRDLITRDFDVSPASAAPAPGGAVGVPSYQDYLQRKGSR